MFYCKKFASYWFCKVLVTFASPLYYYDYLNTSLTQHVVSDPEAMRLVSFVRDESDRDRALQRSRRRYLGAAVRPLLGCGGRVFVGNLQVVVAAGIVSCMKRDAVISILKYCSFEDYFFLLLFQPFVGLPLSLVAMCLVSQR